MIILVKWVNPESLIENAIQISITCPSLMRVLANPVLRIPGESRGPPCKSLGR